MSKADGNSGETHSARLSFRATQRSYEKLVTIAKARGWINAQGRPNVSKVLNFIIDQFDASKETRKTKKEKRRGQRSR
jgi:hypothetical protein